MDKNRKDTSYISVIITAYNRREFLLNAIKSALNQTLDKKHYEIIVIKNFKDEAIDGFIEKKGIKNRISEEELFVGKMLSEALSICKGNVISFLDDDDLFTRDKLEVVYNKFKGNLNLVYYHNNNICVNEEYKRVDIEFNNDADFNMSSISIKRSILNLKYFKKINESDDFFIYISALESGKEIISVNKKLTSYMYHNSWSNIVTKNFNDFKNNYLRELERLTKDYLYFRKMFQSKNALSYINGRLALFEINYYIFKPNKKPDKPSDIFKNNAIKFNFKLELLGAYVLSRMSSNFRDFAIKKVYKKHIIRISKLEE